MNPMLSFLIIRAMIHLHVMVQRSMVLTAVGFYVVSRADYYRMLRRGMIFAPCRNNPTRS
jgi:hypothetical protein